MASNAKGKGIVVLGAVVAVVAVALFLGLRDVPAPIAEKVVEIDAASVAR